MDETTSEQRPALAPLLQPTDTLKQHCLQKNVFEELYPLKEYYLHGQPQSLKAFFNLFLLPSGLPDFDRIVWMENWPTFVIISDEDDASDRMPEDYEARVTL
jgi:hypothetical protein